MRMKGGLSTLIHMSALRPLVICGPSGSGKSTLLKKLLKDFGDYFALSVSHTTRKPRPGEVNGKDYHFISRDEMEQAIEAGEFIEYTEFSGNLYGTRQKSLCATSKTKGASAFSTLRLGGVKDIKNTDLEPPLLLHQASEHEGSCKSPLALLTKSALRGPGGRETEESLRKRLARASEEIRPTVEEPRVKL
uniref:Putative purine nucleotide metabolic process n=1 Tax=Ixodes ricinus TaxID=34613 RepID=V5GYE3_IXORI